MRDYLQEILDDEILILSDELKIETRAKINFGVKKKGKVLISFYQSCFNLLNLMKISLAILKLFASFRR